MSSCIESSQKRRIPVPMGLSTQRNAIREQTLGSGHRCCRLTARLNNVYFGMKSCVAGGRRPTVCSHCFQATTMTSQELAHRGNAATPGIGCSGRRRDIDASAKQSEGSRRNQQTGQRQRKHLRLGSHQYVVLLAATLLVCRSESLLLGAIGDVPHGELGDSSLLTRVKAVKETARAVGSAADRWTGKVKQTLHIKETQVCLPIRSCLSFMLILAGLCCQGVVSADRWPALRPLPLGQKRVQHALIRSQRHTALSPTAFGQAMLTGRACCRSPCMRPRSPRMVACPPGFRAPPQTPSPKAGAASWRATAACSGARSSTTTAWRTSG